MSTYTLGVGEELVLAGEIRVTVLAVEGAEVLFGISTPEEIPPTEAGSRDRDAAPQGVASACR